MDDSTLTRKVAYGRQAVVQGEGCFTECRSPCMGDTTCNVKGV